MPTLPSEPHRYRQVAESFGADPERYDRARPRYPTAMIDRILTALPHSDPANGPELLDVGTGTGIAARQFQAAGCTVLGLDPDERMAAVARRHGLAVEVAGFEDWAPSGRTFDGVVAGQTWHWVDPVDGAARAAEVLRPGGGLALFWNVFQPSPEITAAFGRVYQRVAPALPFQPWSSTADPSGTFTARTIDGLRRAGGFTEPEEWRFEWAQPYTRDAWLDVLPTAGGHHLIPPETMTALLDGIGDVIDGWGGAFVMNYTTIVVYAGRYSTSGRPGPP